MQSPAEGRSACGGLKMVHRAWGSHPSGPRISPGTYATDQRNELGRPEPANPVAGARHPQSIPTPSGSSKSRS